MCWEGPFSPAHKGVDAGRQGTSLKATTVGVRAVAAEVSFSSIFFPNRAEELRVEGEETHKKEKILTWLKANTSRKVLELPVSHTHQLCL